MLMKKIDSFRGEYFFLSNMYPCKVRGTFITADGREFDATFECAEAMFQALKATTTSDFLKFTGIDGQSAKAMGRHLKIDLADWERRKLDEMEFVIKAKFSNPDLAAKLIATGEAELIEGNTWGDRYWGVCRGVGENHLGQILMKVRSDLRKDFKKNR